MRCWLGLLEWEARSLEWRRGRADPRRWKAIHVIGVHRTEASLENPFREGDEDPDHMLVEAELITAATDFDGRWAAARELRDTTPFKRWRRSRRRLIQ
jgi:hypothetical protein